MKVSNRNLLFLGSIFRGYVSFREGKCHGFCERHSKKTHVATSKEEGCWSFLTCNISRVPFEMHAFGRCKETPSNDIPFNMCKSSKFIKISINILNESRWYKFCSKYRSLLMARWSRNHLGFYITWNCMPKEQKNPTTKPCCFTLPETIGPNMIWRQLQHKKSKHWKQICITFHLLFNLFHWFGQGSVSMVLFFGCTSWLSGNIHQHLTAQPSGAVTVECKTHHPPINRPTNTKHSQHVCCCNPQTFFVGFTEFPPFSWFISLFLAPKKGGIPPTYPPPATLLKPNQVTQG